ncbi:MAG: bifunctional 2-polyprenyl-6-hydroxyphenol methylase/3-demethylubiquinol 3-O-methyltransferase UbiG [Rhodospirillaceae bacterium]|nr:bifunctional 2-polyprenyl-6-hydroxyphenol methylase/3-demethylubiquinol 3-O-methyltransferase UbiG [Rhodospirillaceae bacterium]
MTLSAEKSEQSGTASPEEVANFTRLAEEWWNPAGDFKSLHQINPLRMTYIRDQLCSHFTRDPENVRSLEGLSIVDIGCGGGLICEPLTRLGAAVTGIDATPDSIKIAAAHARQMGLDIIYQNILPEELVAAGVTFDVLINMEVIEHVADVDAFMTACAALLKPGGLMVGATLNRTVKSLALAKVAAEYVFGWVPAGTHDWRKFVKPSEFGHYVRANGLELTDLTGLQFNFAGGWSLSKNLDVNYFIAAAKPA